MVSRWEYWCAERVFVLGHTSRQHSCNWNELSWLPVQWSFHGAPGLFLYVFITFIQCLFETEPQGFYTYLDIPSFPHFLAISPGHLLPGHLELLVSTAGVQVTLAFCGCLSSSRWTRSSDPGAQISTVGRLGHLFPSPTLKACALVFLMTSYPTLYVSLGNLS